jgi:type II secretory pathway pseudopilin PulG
VTGTGPRSHKRQGGLAVLILLALLGIMATVLIIKISASAADTIDQDRNTARALGLAREALIARAANDATSPGGLPCPDPNNDVVAELFVGPDCPSYIGRLPWKTLGLADLRDGYGERLWYALSPNFRDNLVFAPINSDTPDQLMVTGLTPAGNVIAIVLAPGPAIGAEQRDAASANSPANYLEGSNATPSPPAGPNLNYVALQPSDTFNDRLLAITSDMLFPEVERRVAREARACLDAFSKQPVATNTGSAGGAFDDRVVWVSASVLLNRMVTAGKLP